MKLNEKKTVLITGGASGIGKACAENYYSLGYNVAIVDIDTQKLAEFCENHPQALAMNADIRFFEQVAATVRDTAERFGGIDILINCAGGNSARIFSDWEDFCDRDIEHIKWGLDVNLSAPVYYCHEVMRIMKEQGSGVIINIGSVTGNEGDSCGSDYAIAKSGVMYGLTRSMAKLGAKYNVRCCCVSPGPVLTRPAMAGMKTLMGRAADPQEIVDAVMFLASDKASFVTGENIMVDGGRSILDK